MPPDVSVVVPSLGDGAAVARLLVTGLSPDPRVELILVDGGADLWLETLAAARPDVRLVRSAPGRGVQMNRGAEAASGEWLLFLHADSTLPDGWVDAITTTAPHQVGGWFRFGLDHPAWQARLIERAVAVRVGLCRLPYGDQGLFVRRAQFVTMGGYAPLSLMEDVEFVRRLVRTGPVAEPDLVLRTSARRWVRDGWIRRSVRNVTLLLLYFVGVPAVRLARWYR